MFIDKNGLINNGDKIVAGVSGGADSVFLFLMLAGLVNEYGLELCAVHVNHGIRGADALHDENYTLDFVHRLGFECYVFRANIKEMAESEKLTEEEAGRRYRYECFERVRKELGYNSIAVAHHQDDEAETVLFQMIRGSSIRGLGGMRPRNGCIIRPLLGIRRSEIENVLKEEGISYCMDVTNNSDDYARNKIRHNVLPYITDNIQPATVGRLASAAGYLRDISDYIDRQAEKVFKSIVTVGDGVCEADADRLIKEDIVIQREIFVCMIERLSGSRKDITAKHIDMLTDILAGQSGRRINLPYGICAGRDYNNIWLKILKQQILLNNDIVKINVPGVTEIEYTDGIRHNILFEKIHRDKLSESIVKNYCTKWFDYDRIKAMPQFRHPAAGDYMWLKPYGMEKKLSRILIDSKIPIDDRKKLWVLAEGGHILWVPELGRCSAYYYVTEKTKEVFTANVDCYCKHVLLPE